MRLGIGSADGCSDLGTAGTDRLPQPAGQHRVGVDLGGGLPLSKELPDGSEVLDIGRTDKGAGQLLREQLPIGPRQERDPPEHLIERDENFPGFEHGIMGPELRTSMRVQAARLGAELVTTKATKVNAAQRPFRIWTGDPAAAVRRRPSR